MATSFQTIFDRFTRAQKNYADLHLDDEILYDDMMSYMFAGVSRFDEYRLGNCFSETTEEGFVNTISNLYIEILIEFMLVEWLKPHLFNSDLYIAELSTKEYTMLSPANLNAQIRNTYNNTLEKATSRLINSTYALPTTPIESMSPV